MLRVGNKDVHIEKNASQGVFIKAKSLERTMQLAHLFYHL